jgi:nucleotide-binding universal stress UspA family protein
MSRLLVGTDGPETSDALLDYLSDALGSGDEVCIMTSAPGGDTTSGAEMAEGEEALDILEEGLGEVVAERHQFVRGNEPVEDLLAAADDFDADEYVIGIRKRSPVGKVMFGSTAQTLLTDADRPVRCVPLVE